MKKYADKDKKFIAKVGEWLFEKVTNLKKNKDVNSEVVEIAEEMAFRVSVLAQGTKAEEESTGETKYAFDGTPEQIAEWEKPITLKDVEVLRSIGRKSINSFTSEEIEKAQKWAYKFYKDLGTKSPFFRAWFGEWRAHDDKTKVSVVKIPDTATENQRSLDGIVVKDTQQDGKAWKVVISGHGERNTRGHSGEKKKSVAGLTNIKSLVENAVLFNTEVHEHHDNNAVNDYIAFDHKLYSLGVNKNGSVALYRITVEEYYQDWRHPDSKRFHNLKYVEEVAQIPVKNVADNLEGRQDFDESRAVSFDETSATTYSIADLYGFVKTFDKDFVPAPEVSEYVLNEDGTPKILYHQTGEDFTVFDPRHKGSGTNDDETPFGIFMKPADNDIGLKGKKQMALYARIVKPLVVNDRADLVWNLKSMSNKYAELVKQRDALSAEYKTKLENAAKAWGDYAKEYRLSHPGATRSEIYNDAEFQKLYDAEDILTEEWIEKADALSLQMKEEITRTLKDNGYDGVILKNDAGSGGRTVETYIALEPTQVKSVTDNKGTFDKDNPDIRYDLVGKKGKRANKQDNSVLNENGEVKDEYFAAAVMRSYENTAKSAQNTAEAYKEANKRITEKLAESERKYKQLVAEGLKQHKFDFVEIENLRSEMRELGYNFEAVRRRNEI